jgi:uncharacterized repeat protein (TIGR03847 family)
MDDLDFRLPDRFTTGAVGEPGQRVFYLQVAESGRVATFRLEKQQVAALADSLEKLLLDFPVPDEPPDGLELEEPLIPEWIVGAMGIGYDDDDDRILIAAQELRPDDDLDTDDDGLDDLLDDDAAPGTARILITRAQAAAFIRHARAIVEAGRPPCPFCGRALDPEGHACPRMN